MTYNNCVIKDDLREMFHSSNKSCTIVYRQSFSCKINCTKVKDTATELHISTDETDRVKSQQSPTNERPRLQAKTRTPGDSDSNSTPLVLSNIHQMTGLTLAMTLSRCQHRKHCEKYYYQYININIIIITTTHNRRSSHRVRMIQSSSTDANNDSVVKSKDRTNDSDFVLNDKQGPMPPGDNFPSIIIIITVT